MVHGLMRHHGLRHADHREIVLAGVRGMLSTSAELAVRAIAAATRPATSLSLVRDALEGIVLRQFHCPSCATLLDTEVTLAQDPPLYDEIRAWPKLL